MNILEKSLVAFIMTSGAVAATQGANVANTTSINGPHPAQETLDNVRGFQDTMPGVKGASQEVSEKVRTLMVRTMDQCLDKKSGFIGKIDLKSYRAEKATWPQDIQQRVIACCGAVTYAQGPYFQIEIDNKGYQTKDGKMFFQTDLTCPRPAQRPTLTPVPTPISTPKKPEESTLDIDINHVG